MNADAVLATILVAHQVGVTPQQRAAAVQMDQQLKSGDISSSAAIGAELAQPSRPLEAQILGYSLLQHLVGHRWEDFPPEASSQLTSLAFSLLHQSAQGGVPWVVRSKAAALLATVIKRSGPEFLDSSLGQILGQAGAGPWMQDVVCLLLNYLTQEVVQMAPEGTAGDTRPLVVRLTAALPQVLGFVESTIEANYSALQQLPGGADRDARAPHVAAINAALGAAKAFADWAPVEELHRSRLVVASGVMLGSADYRGDGCEVLSLIAARKRTNEESEEGFAAAMQEVAAALMQAAEALLAPSALGELDYEGDNDEFGQAVCEAMATLGSFHLGTAFPDPSRRLAFLQIMLAFAQRPYLLLAEKALGLWAKLLQDAAHIKAPMAAPAGDAASPAAAAPPREMPLPPEAVLALMQLAAEQLQQRNPHVPQEDEEIPAYFDTFDDYKELMIGYRLKLSTIVKSAAAVLPQQALHAAAERLNAAVGAAGGVGGAGLEQARVLLESAVVFLESCMKAVWDAVASAGEADRAAVASATEPMLHSLLALQITDPSLLNSQARGLEAFARLAAMKPDLVPGVVSRVFELLVGSIAIEPGGHVAPPSKPAPGWKEGYQARASLSMVLLEYAKACPAAFLPHLEPIAQRLTELSDSAQLRPGEANALREALLAASLAAPESVQASLAEWALAPARAAWTGPEFQASVASPEAFMARYLPTAAPTSDPSGPHVDAAPLRWALYHQVHFVERAVRRMQGAGVSASHPLTAHMAWAVPALLRIVACMNAVHSPAGRAALGAAAAAIDLSPQERALYLKRGAPGARRASAQASSDNPGDFASSGGTSVSSVRVWMRHIREFAFHTLGLLPTHVPPAMDLPGIAPTFAPSAYAFVESLGHQHVRIIIRHVTIPHVKACKARHLESWVLPGLAALAPHMQRRLEAAWVGLAPSAGVESTLAGAPAGEASQVTDEEIIAERLVLELTQEYAELLKEVSTRTLEDPGPPIPAGPAAQGASAAPAPSPAPKPGPKTAAGQGTLLELLLERQPAAGIAAAVAAVAGMQRANDAAFRFAMFCRALVGLAPRDPQLYAYVGSEVLRAAITSLSSEFMASHHADILGLIRAVLVQQLGDPNAAVHSVLQSLPGVTTEREAAFGAALLAMNKEKDQKNAVKEFLLKACGLGSFAALADWRAPSVVPSFGKAKARGRAAVPEDGSDEQLQGDITRALLG